VLAAKGYRILARRWRSPAGEIDLVARRRGIVAFVEVKARQDAASALAAIGLAQRRRIERAAAPSSPAARSWPVSTGASTSCW
jgi:putative endonuclease